MAKNIEIDITKQVLVQNSPFKIIIYVLKDRNDILIEDVNTGKSVLTDSYYIKNYIKLANQSTPWTRMFNHQYMKIEDKHISQFMPLYFEKNKFATLTFKIDKHMAPEFKTKDMDHPLYDPRGEHNRPRVRVVDNSIGDPDETSVTTTALTYNYFYENIKDFEVENFKLEMIAVKTSMQMYDENFEYLKIPHITCRLPMFQLYSILRPTFNVSWTNKTIYGYENNKIFMKIDNKFYRFPYGNSSPDDKICLGSLDTKVKKQPESIEEIAYVHLISTEANGDYIPHVKHDNKVISTFDIEWIREKVNRNDFTFSYMDALFYLSQCKSARDVNINIFLLSLQVPPEILKFEGAEDQAAVGEAVRPDENPVEPEPEERTGGIVIPRAEFTTTTIVRQDGTVWLVSVPTELMHTRYNINNLDPRISFIREIEQAEPVERIDGNAIFLPTIDEERVNTEYMARNNATTTNWANTTVTTGTTIYTTWNTADATAVGDVVRREVVTGVQQEARENQPFQPTPIQEELAQQVHQRLEQMRNDMYLNTAEGPALRQLGTIMAPIDQEPETIIIRPADQVLETLLDPLNVQELTEPVANIEIEFPPNEVENEENQQIIPHPRFWRDPETIIIHQPVQALDRIDLTVNITRDEVTFNEQNNEVENAENQ